MESIKLVLCKYNIDIVKCWIKYMCRFCVYFFFKILMNVLIIFVLMVVVLILWGFINVSVLMDGLGLIVIKVSL